MFILFWPYFIDNCFLEIYSFDQIINQEEEVCEGSCRLSMPEWVRLCLPTPGVSWINSWEHKFTYKGMLTSNSDYQLLLIIWKTPSLLELIVLSWSWMGIAKKHQPWKMKIDTRSDQFTGLQIAYLIGWWWSQYINRKSSFLESKSINHLFCHFKGVFE